MNAKYHGKQICRDGYGNITKILAPTVLVTMKKSEVDKFEKMMTWIAENYCDFAYSMIGESDGSTSAYIDVDDSQEGAEFLMYYKESKSKIS